MKISHKFKDKLNYFLERLSSKPIIGGMQITDSGLQYLRIVQGEPQQYYVKLPPGIIRNGRVDNYDELLKFLKELHGTISPKKPSELIKVILSLPSEVVYTQGFTVPNVGEEKLKEAALLNLQVLSPMPPGLAYMSYQVIGESEERYELLGAFAEK